MAGTGGRRVIAVANQKGGVGKTTTAVNVAAALVQLGQRVLLVDMDPQSNSTSGVGVDIASVNDSTYQVLMGEAAIAEAVVAVRPEGLDLLPATRDLAGAEIELVSLDRREYRLYDALQQYDGGQRIMVVDCPPSLGLLTINALTAATRIVVPLQCEYYALEGISALLETIDMVRVSLNPELTIDGVLLTMFDTRNTICHQVAEEARSHFGSQVFSTVIPRNVRLTESPSHGLPVSLYDPGSRGATSYAELAREILDRGDRS